MGRPRKPKNLLDDSDDNGEVNTSQELGAPRKATLSINKAYAKQYEERKKKELLSRNKHLLEDEEDGTLCRGIRSPLWIAGARHYL